MSELWNNAFHEGSHIVTAHAMGGEITGAMMHSGVCQMSYTLGGLSSEKTAMIECLVSLAGQLGETMFGDGPAPAFDRYSDYADFTHNLKATMFKSASPEVVIGVLTPLVQDILRNNDRAVHQVAARLVQHRHCWGDDLRCVLSLHRKMFGCYSGPMGAADWQGSLLAGIKAQVAVLEAEAKYLEQQAPVSAQPTWTRAKIERKTDPTSRVLWIN